MVLFFAARSHSAIQNPKSKIQNPSRTPNPEPRTPTILWLEAERAIATTFDDLYPAAGLSGGRSLHFSTARATALDRYTARYRMTVPRTGQYVVWSRRHLYYYNEGRLPLLTRLTRYAELGWRVDGGAWSHTPGDEAPVGVIEGSYHSVGHLGLTRTGTAEMAGQYIGWYRDGEVFLRAGEHTFDVTIRFRQTTATPLFRPRPHRYYGLLDAFAFAEPGFVPNGRFRPASAVDAAPGRPRPVGTGAVEVDVSAVRDTIPNLIGFSLVGTDPAQVARVRAIRPGLIRQCHLYNLARVSRGADGRLRIDWTEADRAIDHILSLGSQPLMCLSYTPSILSSRPSDEETRDPGLYPPTNYVEWEEVVFQTVKHFNVDRRLGIRYWEVWNEPNNVFWNVRPRWAWLRYVPFYSPYEGRLYELTRLFAYCSLYEHAARGAIRADPTIRVGGPTALCDGDVEDVTGSARWWTQVLARWCGWRDIRLDFISLHLYGAPPDASGPADYADLIRRARQWGSRSGGRVPEVIIDEWNAWSMEGGHDTATAYHAVWVMETLYAMMEAGARHSVYFGAGGGFLGMLTDQGDTPKPTYNLFRMMSLMGRDRVAAHAAPADVRALASRSGQTVTVLLWRFGAADREIVLSVSPFRTGATVQCRRLVIDDRHSNLNAGLERAELEEVEQRTLSVGPDRRARLTVRLPPTSATLLIFEAE
ncbi:MAG: hypothetical protein HY710_04215 [Candidatus Latescibacteria bacterium]|nr:hypothetical protein [Candidatus Latescibacterota bacterium]